MHKSVFDLFECDAFWYSSAIVLTCFIICLFWFGNKCLQRQHENAIFRLPQPSDIVKIIQCLKKHIEKEKDSII